MDLTQLRQFLMVAERGSLSQAAKALNISQPGLTRSMRRLEAELDAPLLRRLPRGVELTEAGVALQRHVNAVQIQLADAAQEVAALTHRRDTLVRVGAGPSWLDHLLPTVMARAIARDPTLRVQVITGQTDLLLSKLRDGSLEFVLAAIPEGPAVVGLQTTELTRDDVVVVARQGHRLAKRRQVAIEELTSERWVLAGPDMLLRRRLAALLASRGHQLPPPTIESDSTPFILSVIRDSDLLGIATRDILRGPASQGITSLDVRDATMSRSTGIVRRSKTALSVVAENLIDAIERAAKAETL
ncbi:MAG: LysR family transcriptional regulator [Betaproteobacteria bacterium]